MAKCSEVMTREPVSCEPDETIGRAAEIMKREDVGALAPGARAHLNVLDAPSYLHLAYRPGVPLVAEVIA